MLIESTEEGLALHSLDLLGAEGIPAVAVLFLDAECNVPEMAALAGGLATDHPADRRSDFERAVRLAGRRFPNRIEAANVLKKVYAKRGATGALLPREAAGLIVNTFQLVEAELPKTHEYVGDSFGISKLIGLYYSYDDVPYDDSASILEIDGDLRAELTRLATEER